MVESLKHEVAGRHYRAFGGEGGGRVATWGVSNKFDTPQVAGNAASALIDAVPVSRL